MSRLLRLGVCVLLVYCIASLILGSSVIHSNLERQSKQPWWNGRGSNGDTSATEKGGLKNTNIDLDQSESDTQLVAPLSSSFFPTFGTYAFFQKCKWTLQKRNYTNYNCTFLTSPNPTSSEGLSDIMSQLVSGHMIAQQKGCKLFFDYGKQVDISQVIIPSDKAFAYAGYRPINWTVPSESELNWNPRTCFRTEQDYHNGRSLQRVEKELGHIAQIPTFRFAYSLAKHYQLNASDYTEIQQVLPGYTVETGMACSLSSLLRLSPKAAKFEPNLFTRILPTLHQQDTFVMSLYIRTGRTDHLAGMEQIAKAPFAQEDGARVRYTAKRIVQCALHLEQEHFQNSPQDTIVWMVVTDSQYAKRWITVSYDTSHNTTSSAVLPRRKVLTTSSRGAHSRAKRKPSTADFADAFIDWYLIGESHLVVSDTNSPSFGATAALRTARPYYIAPRKGDASECEVAPLVH